MSRRLLVAVLGTEEKMAGRSRHTLQLVLTALAVLFLTRSGNAASSLRVDWCEELCWSRDSDCGQTCYTGGGDLPLFETDCGAYNDGQCGNTCDTTCSGLDSGNTSCDEDWAASSDCGSFGLYLHCGDDVCEADEEDCDTCSADCGTCPDDMSEQEGFDAGEVAEDIELAGGFENTAEGAEAAAAVASAASYVEPVTQERSQMGGISEGMPCEWRKAIIDVDNILIDRNQRMIWIAEKARTALLFAPGGSGIRAKLQDLINALKAQITTLTADRNTAQATRCSLPTPESRRLAGPLATR